MKLRIQKSHILFKTKTNPILNDRTNCIRYEIELINDTLFTYAITTSEL